MSNLTFNVSFRCDRRGNHKNTSVTIPACVPVASHIVAIAARLRMTEEHVSDIVILQPAKKFTSIECGGLPDDVESVAAGY